MKQILGVYRGSAPHWVGDGFSVRTIFSFDTAGQHLSPFLLLDYGAPTRFEPATRPRGVARHPHRGFETVTIAYQGELEHRDSTGSGGRIGPGDVQWMTAASGILHEEFHSAAFTQTGGTLEMAQLWINLRARDKRAAPGYQTLLKSDIPLVGLPGGGGSVRVIAGDFAGHAGPARTFSPMDVWDVRLSTGGTCTFGLAQNRTAAIVVLRGSVRVNGTEAGGDTQLAVLDRHAGEVALEGRTDATVLVLSGEPIDEPIVAYGPFVMNTEDEVVEARDDFRSGRFGRIPRQP